MSRRSSEPLFSIMGYELRKIDRNELSSFAVLTYLKPDGSFDYEAYRNAQTEANKRKIENVWVIEENIAFLSDYIKKTISQPQFGICHGTRRGKEQEWFRKHLNCNVIGTEISDTATDFPNTIQWDFHETKPEWIDAVDFIYSNSLDHSYDPKKCLNAWMDCIRPGGICILEHTSEHAEKSKLSDPFAANLTYMPYLIALWGEGRFGVRQILPAPAMKDSVKYGVHLVIQKF